MHAQAAIPSSLMPYGASELRATERSYMVRAVATGSAAWIGIFILLVTYAVLVPHSRTLELPEAVTLIDVSTAPPTTIEPVGPPKTVPIKIAKGGAIEPTEEVVPADPEQSGDPGPPAAAKPVEAGREYTGVAQKFAPDTSDTVMQSFEVDQLPDAVARVSPDYSPLAIEMRVEGTVMVQVLVGKDGHVREARIAPGTSIPLLNDDALEAAKKWQFTPALSNHRPVSVWVVIPMKFTLR